MRNVQSSHTQLFHHEDLLGLVPDGVGVVEPAVIFVTLLAVSQREALVCGLWQPIAVLHLEHFEVVAVPLTRILLLTSPKCSALHTISVKKKQMEYGVFLRFALYSVESLHTLVEGRTTSSSSSNAWKLQTHLCSTQTPGQVGQISQVGPWNLASVHLQIPHSQLPRPLQICPFFARQVEVSREQSQALPV